MAREIQRNKRRKRAKAILQREMVSGQRHRDSAFAFYNIFSVHCHVCLTDSFYCLLYYIIYSSHKCKLMNVTKNACHGYVKICYVLLLCVLAFPQFCGH